MKTFGGADRIVLKGKAIDPIDCLHYSLTLPTSVVIAGIDHQKVLDQAFGAVKTFHPLDEEELAIILARPESLRWIEFRANHRSWCCFLPIDRD